MSFHVTHMYPFEASWGYVNAAAQTGLNDLEGRPGFPPEPQGSRTIVLDSASTSRSPTQSSQKNPPLPPAAEAPEANDGSICVRGRTTSLSAVARQCQQPALSRFWRPTHGRLLADLLQTPKNLASRQPSPHGIADGSHAVSCLRPEAMQRNLWL